MLYKLKEYPEIVQRAIFIEHVQMLEKANKMKKYLHEIPTNVESISSRYAVLLLDLGNSDNIRPSYWMIYPRINSFWCDLAHSSLDDARIMIETYYIFPEPSTIVVKMGEDVFHV